MRIIKPASILPSALISSNVPEDDYPEWVAGTHGQGDRRIFEHRIYEVVAEATSDSPSVGLAAIPPSWIDLGASNRWKMFDDKVGSLTEQAGSIAVELKLGAVINSIAMFNLFGRQVTILLTDPVDGVVYERDIQLVDAGVSSWYDYFFLPIPRRTDFVLLDLPSYATATLEVMVATEDGRAAVGHMVAGRQEEVGAALYGTSVGIIDYSRKSMDEFGSAMVVQRSYSKRAEFDMSIETDQIGRIQRLLSGVRAQPVVWIGEESYEATVIFGYYRDFSITISGPTVSSGSITVEGLV